jgi:nucleotidyltransferase substrate binding protein (TIGR01987 family)
MAKVGQVECEKGGSGLTAERVREKLANYNQALLRLDEALGVNEPNTFIYDSVIKRFEFTYELAWRLMKAYMEYKGGEDVRFARDVFREAFATGLIMEGEVWLEMMRDRNLSSHTYDEGESQRIYERVKKYRQHFRQLAHDIEKGLA